MHKLLLLFILVLSVSCTNPAIKPNIIFILADDLSYRDLSVFGQEKFTTPNLDKLANEGIVFRHAYAGAPECAPSRGTVITGLHTGHSTIRLNASMRGQDHLLEEDVTIAEVLKTSGYRTAFIGKWGIGKNGTEGAPHLQGFDYSFGYYDQQRAHTYYPDFFIENGDTVWNEGNRGFDMVKMYKMNTLEDPSPELLNKYDVDGRIILPGIINQEMAVYSEEVFQEKALAFINANTEDPFFLYYATQLPHGPIIVDTLGDLKDRTDFPLQKQQEWAAMVNRLDGFAGRLVEFLKEEGKYDNTMFVFSSDNGYSACGYFGRGNSNKGWPDDPYLKNKGPFRGGKFSALEGGTRIPMFIHWNGTIEPGVSDEIVSLIDLLPTFAGLGGAIVPNDVDGIDISGYLLSQDKNLDHRPPLYWECSNEQAVRLDEWKAYRPHPDSLIQLYLIVQDVHCDNDLAVEYPAVVFQMDSIMKASHVDSKWYHNPGDTREMDMAKRKLAQESGQLQKGTRPNTSFR